MCIPKTYKNVQFMYIQIQLNFVRLMAIRKCTIMDISSHFNIVHPMDIHKRTILDVHYIPIPVHLKYVHVRSSSVHLKDVQVRSSSVHLMAVRKCTIMDVSSYFNIEHPVDIHKRTILDMRNRSKFVHL